MKKALLSVFCLASLSFATVQAMNIAHQLTNLERPMPALESVIEGLSSDDEAELSPKVEMMRTLNTIRGSVHAMLRQVANLGDLAEVFNQLAASEADLDSVKQLNKQLQMPPNQKIEREAGVMLSKLRDIQVRGINLLKRSVDGLAASIGRYNQMDDVEKSLFNEYIEEIVEAYNSLVNTSRTYTPAEDQTVQAIHPVLLFVRNAINAQ